MAGLVYGALLTVPGDFVANHGTIQIIVVSFSVCETKCVQWPLFQLPNMELYQLWILQTYNSPSSYSSTTMPIVYPYSSLQRPSKAIKTGPKSFRGDIGGKTDIITTDRLKLAHLDSNNPVWVSQP